MTTSLKTFFYYGVGILALLALASYEPMAAIFFVFLLIAGVLLTHWQDYAPFLAFTGK